MPGSLLEHNPNSELEQAGCQGWGCLWYNLDKGNRVPFPLGMCIRLNRAIQICAAKISSISSLNWGWLGQGWTLGSGPSAGSWHHPAPWAGCPQAHPFPAFPHPVLLPLTLPNPLYWLSSAGLTSRLPGPVISVEKPTLAYPPLG